MHARMTTMEGSSERLDEGLREIKEDVLPQLQQQDGFRGFVVFDNRHNGELVGFSLWDSEEVGERTRRESAETMSDTIAGVERYEVALFEVPSAGPVSGVTDTVGGVTEPVSGVTDTVGGATDTVRGTTD